MRKLSSRRHLLGGAILTVLVAAGCAGQGPTSPSRTSEPAPAAAPVSSGTLTIRVLSRTSEQPIAGATIATSTSHIATDASGVGTLMVIPGEEVDVQVSAAGYDTMGASAVVGPAERWTFYLPAVTRPAAN